MGKLIIFHPFYARTFFDKEQKAIFETRTLQFDR